MSLFRTASRVAVASSVHGKVQRRQARRWATADQAAAQPAAPVAAEAQQPPTPAAEDAMARKLDQLTQLGQLRAAGILTDAEFEAKKAVILAN